MKQKGLTIMASKIIIIILILLENLGFPQLQDKIANRTVTQKNLLSPAIFYFKNKDFQNQNFKIELSPVPQEIENNSIIMEAKSVYGIDFNSSKVLYQKKETERLAPASLTKIMTAVLILENSNLEDVVTISKNAINTEGEAGHLRYRDRIKVKELLYVLLLSSSNDAATALAEYSSGSIEKFVELMNRKANILGLKDTHFKNPSGLDEDSQYSSSEDLANLTSYALSKPLFSKIVATKQYTLISETGYTYNLINTNKLIGNSFFYGVKTGYTEKAGYSLIAAAQKDETKIIIVILNSPCRFCEAQKLTDWIFRKFRW